MKETIDVVVTSKQLNNLPEGSSQDIHQRRCPALVAMIHPYFQNSKIFGAAADTTGDPIKLRQTSAGTLPECCCVPHGLEPFPLSRERVGSRRGRGGEGEKERSYAVHRGAAKMDVERIHGHD
jgi:hypothetical protein